MIARCFTPRAFMALACAVTLPSEARAQATKGGIKDGEIVATGKREGYTPADTSAAKITAPLRDIPQSGAVVPATDPIPLTSPSTWISQADYKRELHAVEGRTVASLSVDARGRVTACQIKLTSGSDTLDETVCRRARAHGRFKPAHDASGVATNGSYVFPVIWGDPRIDIEADRSQLVAVMKKGKATSCVTYSFDGSPPIQERSCNVSEELLLEHFGPRYKLADQLTIERAIIAGHEPVIRGTPDGTRVTLKESVVTIGPDGRAQACESRIPSNGAKLSFYQCLGYQPERKFTGLPVFVQLIDWTIHYPSTAEE